LVKYIVTNLTLPHGKELQRKQREMGGCRRLVKYIVMNLTQHPNASRGQIKVKSVASEHGGEKTKIVDSRAKIIRLISNCASKEVESHLEVWPEFSESQVEAAGVFLAPPVAVLPLLAVCVGPPPSLFQNYIRHFCLRFFPAGDSRFGLESIDSEANFWCQHQHFGIWGGSSQDAPVSDDERRIIDHNVAVNHANLRRDDA